MWLQKSLAYLEAEKLEALLKSCPSADRLSYGSSYYPRLASDVPIGCSFSKQMNVCHIIFTLDECIPPSSSLCQFCPEQLIDRALSHYLSPCKGPGKTFTWGNLHTLQGCAQVMQPQYVTNICYTVSSDKARNQPQIREYNSL